MAFTASGKKGIDRAHLTLLDLPVTFERLRWYETPFALIIPFCLCFFVFLIGFIGHSWTWVSRRIRKRSRNLTSIQSHRYRFVFWLHSFLGLAVFGYIVWMMFAQPGGFDPLVSRSQIILFQSLTWCAVLFVFPVFLCTSRAWKENYKKWWLKCFLMIETVAGITFVWLAFYWNWLGI